MFFFNDTATTEIYTLSLHDALPISAGMAASQGCTGGPATRRAATGRSWSSSSRRTRTWVGRGPTCSTSSSRSEEHTSELQSRQYLVCRLLLEKKNITTSTFSLQSSP